MRRSVIVDMDVEGKTNYRLITSWPKGKSEPTYWATNLSREKFNTKEHDDYGRSGIGKFIDVVSKMANRGECSAACWGRVINIYGSKNTQGWFYQLMESITQEVISILIKAWQKTINFLSKYAQRASLTKDKEKAD